MATPQFTLIDALTRAESEQARLERELVLVLADWRRQRELVAAIAHQIEVTREGLRGNSRTLGQATRSAGEFAADELHRAAKRQHSAELEVKLRSATLELRYQQQRVRIRREMVAEAEARVQAFERLCDAELRDWRRSVERRMENAQDEVAGTSAARRVGDERN